MPSETQVDLIVSARVILPAKEFEWSFARGSGPGGQNVNKVNSKATLRWRPLDSALPEDVRRRFMMRYATRLTTEGELLIESEESRDQPQNVRRCLEKLKDLLLTVLVPPKKRKPTKRTAGSQRRRLAEKKLRSDVKNQRRAPRDD
jgi:ribosome-associated protein